MEKEIIIGKYTLESLTNGMYSNPLDLYREYIQNAVDSIDSAQEDMDDINCEYEINVEVDDWARVISIKDNGKGIPQKKAIQVLIDIGNSQKDKRKTRGFRGIGRLAGLGYCEELKFTTSYQGEKTKTIVCFDTKLLEKLLLSEDKNVISIHDVMEKVITTLSEQENENSHYFKVTMDGVSTKEKLLDIRMVENYLIQHVPLPYDPQFVWAEMIREKSRLLGYHIPEYMINLNGKQLYKPYKNTFLCDRVRRCKDNISDIEIIPFYRDDKLTAILWSGIIEFYGTILDNQIKGIRIRQGNMLVGDKATCNDWFKEERFNGWLIGELYVLDPEMIVNARRDYFEPNEAHYDLSEAFKEWSEKKIKYIKKLSYARNLTAEKNTVVNEIDSDKVNIKKIESNNYRECDFINKNESEEISEIGYMNKLFQIVNQKQRITKYTVLNINEHISNEQKKILEKVFDIIIKKYDKKVSEKFIQNIIDNL